MGCAGGEGAALCGAGARCHPVECGAPSPSSSSSSCHSGGTRCAARRAAHLHPEHHRPLLEHQLLILVSQAQRERRAPAAAAERRGVAALGVPKPRVLQACPNLAAVPPPDRSRLRCMEDGVSGAASPDNSATPANFAQTVGIPPVGRGRDQVQAQQQVKAVRYPLHGRAVPAAGVAIHPRLVDGAHAPRAAGVLQLRGGSRAGCREKPMVGTRHCAPGAAAAAATLLVGGRAWGAARGAAPSPSHNASPSGQHAWSQCRPAAEAIAQASLQRSGRRTVSR